LAAETLKIQHESPEAGTSRRSLNPQAVQTSSVACGAFYTPSRPVLSCKQTGRLVFGVFWNVYNRKPQMKSTTKHVKISLSGDADAVQATIALLNHLNFINGSLWSNAVRKRGEPSVVRVASRSIDVHDHWSDDSMADRE
jgi:hypothetical protein